MESAPSIQIATPRRTHGMPGRSTPIPRRNGLGRAQAPTLPPQQMPLRDVSSLPPVAGSIPPEPSHRSGVRNFALLAAAVAAVMVFAAVLRLRPGTLVITASGDTGGPPAAIKFVVDGVERCRTAPCRIDRLAPGAHLIGVSAEGFAPFAERAIVIEPGEHAAQHIELTTETPAIAQLQISVSSPGAVVWIDGTEVGPAPIGRDLRPGQHSVRVIDPQHRSKSYDGTLTLEPGEHRQLGPIALEPLAPVQAVPVPQMILPAETPNIPAVAQTPTAPTKHAHRAAVGNTRGPASSAPLSAAATTTQMATLDLTSEPPAPVVLNGRPLGMTPLHLAVPPGPQSVLFVHPELGRKAATVELVAGARKAVAVRF